MLTNELPEHPTVELFHHTTNIEAKKPTLIHLFGPIDSFLIRIMRSAYSLRIPVVYTPFGSFLPWNNRSLPAKYINYINAIHSSSLPEHQAFQAEVTDDKECALIPNPTVTNQLQWERASEKMNSLYHSTIRAHHQAINKQIASTIKSTGIEDTNIIQICHLLLYAQYELHRGELSLGTLSSIATALNTFPYDELKMASILSVLNIHSFTARIEAIAQERALLTEGFMPINKLDDAKTKEMRAKIQTENVQEKGR